MTRLATTLLVFPTLVATLSAQERDRSVERIALTLQHPPSPWVGRLTRPAEPGAPVTLGPFTFVPPVLRGEFVRVSFPIGEFVSKAVHGLGELRQRRQERDARRQVQEELEGYGFRLSVAR